MSWTKKNVHPGKIVSTSQEVEVKVLEVDQEKRRISLGLKQAQANPWADFAEKYPVGTEVEGEVKNSTEFGLFIGLPGDVDGMVHMSDIAWGISGEDALHLHRKGESVKAVVLEVDVERERISLGMKQLERGGVAKGGTGAGAGANKGDTVTVTVLEVRDGGLEVQIGDDGASGFIKRTDLGRDRDEQRPERFQVGQKFDAMVTGFDRSKKPNFSIKALQISEEKQAVAQYGSSDSGASLGDILGAALKEAGTKPAAKADKAEAKPAKAKKADKAETEAEDAEAKPAKKTKAKKTDDAEAPAAESPAEEAKAEEPASEA
jgi:small subunit ribosomal protein S1